MPVRRAADLVASFDFPRETAAQLQAASDTLVSALRAADLAPRILRLESHPHRADAAAIAWAAAAAILLVAAVRRRRARGRGRHWRPAAAAAAAVWIGIAALAGGLDALLPARASTQVEVVVEPRRPAERELLLGAHYDSKTEPFDHVERAVAFAAAAVLFLAAAAMRRRSAAAAACALAAFAAGGGRFAGARSHGIADDAAAVALLIEIAADSRAAPPASTRLRCVWWCDEEQGAQGSSGWVRRTELDAVPRIAVNLECIGAGPRLGYTVREWAGARWYATSSTWAGALHAAAGGSLAPIAFPVVTDAGSLRRAGIDAGTLVGLRAAGGAPRGLHRPSDRLAALDRAGLDAAGVLVRRLLAAP
jgi:hypothetical protein